MIVKKHLGRQEIQPAVHLFFQVADILLLSRALHMTFRIAGSAKAEIPALFQKLDQPDGMLKLVLRRVLHSLRNVAPKSQHIFNAFFF